jgi:hypothetical protein
MAAEIIEYLFMQLNFILKELIVIDFIQKSEWGWKIPCKFENWFIGISFMYRLNFEEDLNSKK